MKKKTISFVTIFNDMNGCSVCKNSTMSWHVAPLKLIYGEEKQTVKIMLLWWESDGKEECTEIWWEESDVQHNDTTSNM